MRDDASMMWRHWTPIAFRTTIHVLPPYALERICLESVGIFRLDVVDAKLNSTGVAWTNGVNTHGNPEADRS